MKSQITAFFILVLGTSSVFAANKDAACNAYMQSAMIGQSETDRLHLAVAAMNDVYELNFNSKELIYLEASLLKKISAGEVDQTNVENATYFGCVNELSAADKKIMQDQLKSLL